MELVGKYPLSIVKYPSPWLSVISYRACCSRCVLYVCVRCVLFPPVHALVSRLTIALPPNKDLVRIQKATIDVTARNSVLGDIT